MLEIVYSDDEARIQALRDRLCGGKKSGDAAVILTDGGRDAGLAELSAGDTVCLKSFKLAPESDDFFTQDFFFRAILWKLSFNDYTVEIPVCDKRLLKFGFEEKDGKMQINSRKIVFPCECEKS